MEGEGKTGEIILQLLTKFLLEASLACHSSSFWLHALADSRCLQRFVTSFFVLCLNKRDF